MAIIGKEKALLRMGDERLGLLRLCVEAAWEAYEQVFRPLLPLCSAVGVANILHELVIQEVRNRFSDMVGVEIKENIVRGRFLLYMDGRLVIQFKKLTRDFRTVNNPTDTSEAFDNQEGIEGMPEWPRLTVGYQLGQYGTSLSIYLAFLIGKECIWHHDLSTYEGSLAIEFPEMEGPSAAEREAAEEEERKRRESGESDEGKQDG